MNTKRTLTYRGSALGVLATLLIAPTAFAQGEAPAPAVAPAAPAPAEGADAPGAAPPAAEAAPAEAPAAPAAPEATAEPPAPEPMPVVEAPMEEAVAEEAPAAEDPDGPKLNMGLGLRVSYNLNPSVPDEDYGHFIGYNVRPYISGQANRYIKFEAHLDSTAATVLGPGDVTVDSSGAVRDADGDGALGGSGLDHIRPLDAVLKFEFHDYFNIWGGRFLPPSDRANLSGPYFQNAWNYPVQSNLYPAIYAGRHDGVAYWGQAKEGAFKWQLGMFDVTGTDDRPLFAGRVVLNVLDPEPGYYNSSTYYGEKEILALGGTFMAQKKGELDLGFGSAFNLDLLFEKKFGASGVLTAELAYYNFKGADQGSSFWGLVSYLVPTEVGIGKFQPMFRLQSMQPEDDTFDNVTTIDAGLHYIMNGHSARMALNYQNIGSHDGIDSSHLITIGGQLQL